MVTDQLVSQQNQTQKAQETRTGWLGLQLGEHRLLVNLADVVEVLPVPLIQPVPLTKDWFLGTTNVRGNLVCVTDLSRWMGMDSAKLQPSSRMVLLNSVRTTQAAILVSGVLGLQNVEAMEASSQDFFTLPSAFHVHQDLFDAGTLVDTKGQQWLQLNVDYLLSDQTFLQPGLAA